MSTRCSEFPFSFPLLDFSNFFPSIFLQILHQKISISLENRYIIRVVLLSLKFRFTNVISVFYDIFNSITFSKETFFEARKARINLGRPEMEKRKEKKRRREEKIFVINGDQDLWIGRVVGRSCSRCCSDIYRFAGVTKP